MFRTIISAIMFVFLFYGLAQAECTSTIVSVEQDQRTGAVIVNTAYAVQMSDEASAAEFAEKIGGIAGKDSVVTKEGRTRYDEESGNLNGIKQKIQDDINKYCEALIERIPANTDFITSEIFKQNKFLTNGLVTDLQSEVGKVAAVSYISIVWKGKTITVTDDSNNSVSNITP